MGLNSIALNNGERRELNWEFTDDENAALLCVFSLNID